MASAAPDRVLAMNFTKHGGRLLILGVLTLPIASGCVRNRSAGIRGVDMLAAEGLRAFHQGTPDGFRRAAAAFRQASAIDPENCDHALHLAESLAFLSLELRLNFEEFETVRAEGKAAVPAIRCPGDDALRTRVVALVDYPEESSREAIERAVLVDPDDAVNWVVYWKLLPLDPDQASVDRPENLDPASALVQFEAGQFYRRGAEFDRATEAYGRALALNPSHYRAYLGLGHAAFESDTGDAAIFYRQAVRLAPDFLEGRLALAEYLAATDDVDGALAEYAAAIESNGDYHPAHFGIGVLLLDDGRPDDAEPHFREVVRLDESNPDAYYYLGNIQYERRRFGWAQIQYELALAWEPTHVNAEYGYGKAAQELGDLDEALRRYEHVIEMAPRFPDGYFSRASVHSLRERYADAVGDYATTSLVGEQAILQTDTRIRAAAARGTAVAVAERRRLEDYKTHLEELLSYTSQNRAAIETYLRQVEEFQRAQRRVSEQ